MNLNQFKTATKLFAVALLLLSVSAYSQTGCYTMDFNTDANGDPILAGQVINDGGLYTPWGVSIETAAGETIVAFDSSNPTGGDVDLGSPSIECPTCNDPAVCPGVSNNGGGITNCTPLGMVLIQEEDFVDANGDGYDDDPDDTEPGTFNFCFDAPVTIGTMGFIDDSVGEVTFEFSDGSTQTNILLGGLDNDAFEEIFNISDVVCMNVYLTASGAITFNTFCYDTPNPTCDLVAPVLGADQAVCAGTDPTIVPVDVPASGTGTILYQWQQSNTGCVGGFNDIPGATGATYDPPAIMTELSYRVVTEIIIAGEICIEESNCITYTIQTTPSVNILDPGFICADEGTRTILANPSGGTFSGANISAAGVFNVAAAGVGTHTVNYTFSGGAGCSGSDSRVIEVVPAVEAFASQTVVSCLNGDISEAMVAITGGTGPFDILWNDPSAQTTSTATGLAPGIYVVTVTDVNGCSVNASVTVLQSTDRACANITTVKN